MSSIHKFDIWFEDLPEKDKTELLQHIITSHFHPTMEGINVGPPGRLIKGLFSGPAGYSVPAKCSYCGK